MCQNLIRETKKKMEKGDKRSEFIRMSLGLCQTWSVSRCLFKPFFSNKSVVIKYYIAMLLTTNKLE